MPADYVRPYRKGGKNDASDAEAICEAVQRPGMRFVAVKTAEQQGVLALHRARALLRQVRRHMAAGRPSGLPWAERLLRRRPPNVVAVALANKLARQGLGGAAPRRALAGAEGLSRAIGIERRKEAAQHRTSA